MRERNAGGVFLWAPGLLGSWGSWIVSVALKCSKMIDYSFGGLAFWG